MLQWNDGTWEHRAYWGANLIAWGTDGTANRRYMGPLPPTGQWAQLSVPASSVNLEGRSVSGMSYTLFDGRATFDYTGKSATSGSTYRLTGTVTAGASPVAGVVLAATNGGSCSPTQATGQFTCVVPAGWSGTITPASSGFDFTPTSRTYAAVAGDQAGQDFTAVATPLTVWVDDALPAGATPVGEVATIGPLVNRFLHPSGLGARG